LQGSDQLAYLQFLTIITILHEATHLLVQLVSPGVNTPIGIGPINNGPGESGYSFEDRILHGTLSFEIRKSDIFHLHRVRSLLIQRPDYSFRILNECAKEILI
jgi:hypothetical protein